MKRFLGLFCVLAVAAVPAGAQLHSVGVYSDAAGSDCNLIPNVFLVETVYVVYTGPGLKTVGYQIDVNWPAAVYLSAALPYICLAPCDPVLDGTVWSFPCQSGPVVLASLSFLPVTPTNVCGGTLQVMPFGSALLEVEDCAGATVPAIPGKLTVNGDPVLCPCAIAVPVEETSWGRVKSLYK